MKCILLSLHNLISYTRLDFKLSTSPSSRIWLNHLLQQTRNSQKRSNNNLFHSIKNWSFPQPKLESILKSWLLLRMPLLLQRVSHSDKSRSIEWELRPWLSCLTHRTGFSKYHYKDYTIEYSILTRDLVYMGAYGLGITEDIIKLGRQALNTMFYTKSKIGFSRFIDGK